MSAFGMSDIAIALALGILIGAVVAAGASAQLRSADPGALAALQERMGSLFTACLFASGASPTMVIVLLGTMRAAPTLVDTVAMILLVGLGMLASFTLFGNLARLGGGRPPAPSS